MRHLPRRLPVLMVLGAAAIAGYLVLAPRTGRDRHPEWRNPGKYPLDYFSAQRAFPGFEIPHDRYLAALDVARLDRALPDAALEAAPLTWEEAGPFNIGGRVTALAANPGGVSVYLGAANGGVFKSTNSGVNWTPVFDQFGVFSIGALAIDPSDSNRVYVGTGEANASVDSYDGAGLFRSSNAGASWSYVGLQETRRIARVAVDPSNPSRVYVAAMGKQFSTGPDRGLYRTTDNGITWSKVLFVTDSTGACDVVINPAHPETVYCATWERIRRPTYRRAYGPSSGIWRSADYGSTWTRLTNGLPTPSDSVGRIGLAMFAGNPSTLYAQIVGGANLGYNGLGLYRTTNAGQNWVRRDVGTGFTGAFGGFGWYFGDVVIDPVNVNRLWCLGQNLVFSSNGGQAFGNANGSAHVDFHAIWIDRTNPARIYIGTDGGFYRSTNSGGTWSKSLDLPISQFYAGSLDPRNPARLLGGTQDNGTVATSGAPTAWAPLGIGGDGFVCLVDPAISTTVFAEYQYCCYGTGPQRSLDGGSTFSSPTGFVASDRYNWCAPIAIHPLDHNVVLTASQRVYRSTDNGVSYSIISPNLTTDPVAAVVFGTITTLDISPADTSVYYAGTDDGKVWRSIDRSGSWTDISAGLPQLYVTRVTADPVDPNRVYVTHSGFGYDQPTPHVHRSDDRGDHWTSIAANLPDAPANDILVDPLDTQTLYLGTDLGVYISRTGGAGWFPLGRGMPIQTVFDLTLHSPSRTLVAATHGRSQWKINLSDLPVAVKPAIHVALELGTPAPNPSHDVVRFALQLPAPSAVECAIYDTQGRRLATLVRGPLEPGRHDFVWDGRDAAGHRVGPGVFFARARAGGAMRTQRIVRID